MSAKTEIVTGFGTGSGTNIAVTMFGAGYLSASNILGRYSIASFIISANQITVKKFYLPVRTQFSKVTVAFGSFAGGPFKFAVAFYDINLKLIVDSGVISAVTNTTPTTNFPGGLVVLPAGIYYIACASNSALVSVSALPASSAQLRTLAGSEISLNNGGWGGTSMPTTIVPTPFGNDVNEACPFFS